MIVRNVEVEGRAGLDVRLANGVVAEIGTGLRGPVEIDGRGGALIPGLIDHHIHLLGLAAQADSAVLDEAGLGAIGRALVGRPEGAWLRATGYHERMAGLLDRHILDRISPRHPLRVQHQSGALWVLNSAALERVMEADPPPCVELEDGVPTGRIWRGDAWLSGRIGRTPPSLDGVGRTLAAFGVTGVMDASASNNAGSAALIAATDLPQRVGLMSAGLLAASEAWRVGPVKVLLDEHDLPDFDDFLARIAQARAWGRRVAVHCVTAVELAYTLAVFEAAGTLPGDRIEHGGVIPDSAIPTLAAFGLTVVTQPGFVFERGERYLAEVDPAEHDSLYRCASLLAAGVPVAASSDAPYTQADPWAAIRAAVARTTRAGAAIGSGERVDARTALGLYLGDFDAPGGPERRVAVGQPADLCLLAVPLAAVLAAPDAELVAATFVGGRAVYGTAMEAAA